LPARPSWVNSAGPLRVVTVASLEQPYKGVDTLIDAVALLVREGLQVELSIIGEGRCRPGLEARAAERGLGAAARFAGHLPRDAVLREVERHHAFVLASRTEGLPRAMIEAMALGRPCLGTWVGGIPELLEPDEMAPPDEPGVLAGLLRSLAADPARARSMAERNLAKAAAFAGEGIRARRAAFLAELRRRTARAAPTPADGISRRHAWTRR
jgi:phosphatidylinositol alpha-1,6-mannosyltransferase